MNLQKTIAAAILLGLAAANAACANADDVKDHSKPVADSQFGNGNVSQTSVNSGSVNSSSNNGNNSVTSIVVNDHALLIRNDRVWVDGQELFGQQAEDAIHAASTGQQWW